MKYFLLALIFATGIGMAHTGVAQDGAIDTGAPELASRVRDIVLLDIVNVLKKSKDAGVAMNGEPSDLMPAQDALQWISQRPYILENGENWPHPEVTESRIWADCKGKSLWLADRLLRLGYANVKIVIGRIPKEQMGHAWVELQFKDKTYILDGTYRGRFSIIPADRQTVHTDHKVLHVITYNGYQNK